MDIQTLAIITLLGSFAVMIFLRFPLLTQLVCLLFSACWCRTSL